MRCNHTKLIYRAPLLLTLILTLAACNSGSKSATPVPTPLPALTRPAYVANYASNTVSMYTVNGNNGQFQLLGTVNAGNKPNSVTVHPSGRYAYVVNRASNNVSAYTINASTGELTAMSASPYPTGGTGPRFAAIDPQGRFIVVTNFDSGTLAIFSIDATTGALTALTGSPLATGQNPFYITIDPSGRFIYVANVNLTAASSISVYTVNATSGVLSAVAGSPFSTGSNPLSLAVDPSGRFLYAATYGPLNYGSGGVSAYAINATSGALTPVTPFFRLSSLYAAGTGTNSVSVDPSGKFLYVANEISNDLSLFSIDATSGALTALAGSPFAATGAGPHSLIVDPSGKFLYVVNEVSNDILAYAIDTASGAITAAVGSPMPNGAGTGPRSLRIVVVP